MWPPLHLFSSYCGIHTGLHLQELSSNDSGPPLILNASLVSLGITVTLLAWTAKRLTSLKSPTMKFSQTPKGLLSWWTRIFLALKEFLDLGGISSTPEKSPRSVFEKGISLLDTLLTFDIFEFSEKLPVQAYNNGVF